MPLVMLCGYPSSGKTFFSNKLQKYLESIQKNVVVISDDSVGIDRNKMYHRYLIIYFIVFMVWPGWLGLTRTILFFKIKVCTKKTALFFL